MKQLSATPSITIIGMGALGILYGDIFTQKLGRESVTFLADKERIHKYKTESVYCNGKLCDFQMASKAEPADFLIFAVKGTALEEAIELSRPAVNENTIILSLLNGISSEEIIASRMKQGHIIHCIAQGMDAVKLGNELTYAHIGELRIGTPESSKRPYLEQVETLLHTAGIPCIVEEDIIHRLWGKWMLNVGVNQVVMVSEGTYKTVQEAGKQRDMMIAAMEEVLNLSICANTGVTRDDLNNYVSLIDTLNPDGMPSMRQDGILKRRTEVDLFAGTVITMAKEYGLDVPVNQMLYDKIKEMEAEMPHN